jgi:type II secretory pathway component GspD/PulD (secretin)
MANNKNTGSNFKMFLKDNKTLAVSVPILVILIIAVIIIYSSMGSQDADGILPALAENAPAGLEGTRVEILPQTERITPGTTQGVEGGASPETDGAVKNPFNSPITLKGVVARDDDEGAAILETGGKTLIVRKDDVLENGMTVGGITLDRVILIDNGKDIELKMERNYAAGSAVKSFADSVGSAAGSTAENSSESAGESRGTVSINVADADIRDVLSLLALNMDTGIIYLEEPFKVSFAVNDIKPMKALQLLLQSVSPEDKQLGCIENGSLIVVGSHEKLRRDFFNQLAITRFKLSYMSPDDLGKIMEKMKVPVLVITATGAEKYAWAQGTPQALAKVSSVIAALDRAENFESEDGLLKSQVNLTRYDLKHITADRLEKMILQLNIAAQIIRSDMHAGVLWVNAKQQALKDIEKLIAAVDIPDVATEPYEMVSHKMKNLVYDRLVPIINETDITVQVIRVGSSQKQVWLFGERREIDRALSLIKQIDVADNGEEAQFFVYSLKNISPEEAEEKLEFLEIPGISVMPLNYPGISHEILIKCPFDMMGAVSRIISSIDVMGRIITAPVDHAESSYQLTKRKELICRMMDIPPENLIISDDVSRDGETPHYVMWTTDTPENIRKIREMVELIDKP